MCGNSQAWKSLAAVGILFVVAAPCARANTGVFFVTGLTPLELGATYLALMVLGESAALWRLGGLSAWRAFAWCLLGNAWSAVFGGLLVWFGAAAVTVFRANGDPVERLVAVNAAFFALSVTLEGAVYQQLAGGRRRKMAREAWRGLLRATVVGNAVSHAVALAVLLASPGPYLETTRWQWSYYNASAANKALKQYLAEHNGRPPGDRGPYAINEALAPYLAGDERPILRDGRLVFYDRPRLRRDWPELRLDIRPYPDNRAGDTQRWEVFAPDLEEAAARAGIGLP